MEKQMKSLKHYLVESLHTYNMTIKIAGEVNDNWLDMFKYNLKKFDPIEMSPPKTLPIQREPYGFPDLKNAEITIIKCKFRYPATEPMIRQIGQMLHMDENRIRVVSSDFDDSIDSENNEYENEMKNSPLLEKPEMSEQPGAKEASKAYGESYLNSIKDQMKDSKMYFPFSGEKTKDSFDPFKPFTDDKKEGDMSPMSKITRPAKPKTGAMS
jgi:hypothetical protein